MIGAELKAHVRDPEALRALLRERTDEELSIYRDTSYCVTTPPSAKPPIFTCRTKRRRNTAPTTSSIWPAHVWRNDPEGALRHLFQARAYQEAAAHLAEELADAFVKEG